jgi:hypothetical protein
MTNDRSTKREQIVSGWLKNGPGAGNGLEHVRALFKAAFPGPWGRGFTTHIGTKVGVEPDLVHRVFRANPAWGSIPKPSVITDLATVLGMPRSAVLFAFMADIHPDAVDAEMYAVLREIALKSPSELAQMRECAGKFTSQG